MTEENQSNEPQEENSPAGSEENKSELTADEKTMGMLCHLLGVFTWFLGPLIIWLIKKDESAYINDQGKEALNFGITMMIGWVVSVIAAIVSFGILFFLPPIVAIGGLVFFIIGTVKANDGIKYRYPICIRLVH
ncbi:DUF4870 domain-containing protein [Poriferisphaera corsica]|nr:DUF4870 domain-containing protein [Poriferisphaera corsica]